ncbi:MAG: PSD1 and planctomycete cytochrome C domain-containing protein, partial [Gemmataceae bacterium]
CRSIMLQPCVEAPEHSAPDSGAGVYTTVFRSTREKATQELRSGDRAIVPGDPAKSTLLARVSLADGPERMPPKGEPLSAKQVAILRDWIAQGAKYETHWAYLAPVRPAAPALKNPAWVRVGFDAHILARLEKEGLAPTPEADRATWLRRVTLDLTGLPPTPQEVRDFLADHRADAYERVVDRLLASPAYGEHQARYWLDLARYADTNGYEKDERRSIWPYRDWVIRAFNANMPFDQFTLEQLAGDLLPEATTDQKIATGFHRNTMTNTEGGTDDEEFRVAAVVDRVNTTMEVWMGTTMACAQCHNHKYDPFTMRDYYALFAIFNNTADGGRSLAPVLELPTDQEQLQRSLLMGSIDSQKKSRALVGAIAGPGAAERLHPSLPRLLQQLASIRPASTLVMQELPRPRQTHLLIRGNHKSKGQRVLPDTPAALPPRGPGVPANRVGLAKWLTAADNPLTARVLANRLWARFFGRGLVETSEEFGSQGEPPSHPEVLDWLATELHQLHWDLKAFQRQIVLSATYRQASRVGPDQLARDPFNRLLSRGPRFRLDAETIRDQALAIGGLLYPVQGGPSVFPHQPEGVWFQPYSGDRWVVSSGGDRYRRGLYTFWRRTAPYATFMAFDAPSREVCTERRPRSNTPLQALATLNDPAFVEAAIGLARRMLREGQDDPLGFGFLATVGRLPSQRERAAIQPLIEQTHARYLKDRARAKALIASLADGSLDEVQWATWTVVANVLLNLDETITKG